MQPRSKKHFHFLIIHCNSPHLPNSCFINSFEPLALHILILWKCMRIYLLSMNTSQLQCLRTGQ